MTKASRMPTELPRFEFQHEHVVEGCVVVDFDGVTPSRAF